MPSLPYPVEEHSVSKETMVNAFGMILYTGRHPHIKKVLTDDDYWNSLHEISGPKWRIFSIRPKAGHHQKPELEAGALGMMVPIWKEPRENKLLLEKFGLESTEDLPCLVTYCYAVDKSVLSQSIKLEESSVEEAYSSLKEAVQVCTDAIDGIAEHNRDCGEGINAALELQISTFKNWKRLKKAFDVHNMLKRLIP